MVFWRPVVRNRLNFYISQRNIKSITEVFEFVERQLLHLMRGVFGLTCIAHPIAFDSLRHDDRRLTLMVNGCVIRSVDLLRIVTASIEAHDLIVA